MLLLGILMLMHFSRLFAALPDLSRNLVVIVANLFGMAATNSGHEIQLGSLVLPWTQDCSGFHTLVFLWAVTLWANRDTAPGLTLFTRLILCLPMALIANTLRVFCIAGYRYIYYPDWESPQLHYFIGFLCTLPFMALMVSRFQHRSVAYWLELLYMASVFALVAPLIFAPGGSLVSLCAFFFLARSRFTGASGKTPILVLLAWLLAAVVIAHSRTESLWLPWLLVAPQFVDRKLLRSVPVIVILTGTLPLLSSNILFAILVSVALLFEFYRLYKGNFIFPASTNSPAGPAVFACVAGLIAPFFLSQLVGITQLVEPPPRGIMSDQLSFNSFLVRTIGQTPDITSFWFGAFADGRHHSLVSCMKFRGINLQPVENTSDTYEGEGKWMKEYFIHEGEILDSYSDYLLASFSPFSSPGVHLIYESSSTAMSAGYFEQETKVMAHRLFQLSTRR